MESRGDDIICGCDSHVFKVPLLIHIHSREIGKERERYSVVDSASSGALHNDDPFAAFRPWELTMNAMEEENGLHLL